jgi:hypothetical protein
MDLERQILVEHSVINAEKIALYIEDHPEKLEELLQLILQGNKITAQRGAWVLGKLSKRFHTRFLPYLDFIISEIKDAKHVAVSRNFAKVFMVMTRKIYLDLLTKKQIDDIVEICFGWVIDINQKAAVVAFSMYTLQNISTRRDWIAPELKLFIENNMAGSLPSFQSAGRKILKSMADS